MRILMVGVNNGHTGVLVVCPTTDIIFLFRGNARHSIVYVTTWQWPGRHQICRESRVVGGGLLVADPWVSTLTILGKVWCEVALVLW